MSTTVTRPEAAPTLAQPPSTMPARPATTPPAPIRSSKKRRKVIRTAVYVVVLLGIAAGAYYYFRPAATTGLSVRYATVESGDMVKAVTATGILQAITTVQVGTQVSGTLLKLYADFNSVVKKGQLLAQLDPVLFQSQVNADKANLAQSEANLAKAERDEARAAELLKSNLVSPSDYDVTKTALLVAQANVKQIRANLERSTTNLGLSTIHSPVNGTVQSRNVDVGQTVAASLNAPVLFTIAEDLSKMWVAASVDEADIGQVRDSQDVKFTVESYPGETFYGRVVQIRINPITQQNVVTYNVMITTDNSSGKLLPGMTATVNIISAARKHVLKIPTAALQFKPPPEMFTTADSSSATTGGEAKRQRRQSGQSGANPAKGIANSDTGRGIIYLKSKTPDKPVIRARVITGLADGSSTEIISSNPPIAAGDSVIIGAFSTAPAATTGQPGANPLGGQARGGGPARRL